MLDGNAEALDNDVVDDDDAKNNNATTDKKKENVNNGVNNNNNNTISTIMNNNNNDTNNTNTHTKTKNRTNSKPKQQHRNAHLISTVFQTLTRTNYRVLLTGEAEHWYMTVMPLFVWNIVKLTVNTRNKEKAVARRNRRRSKLILDRLTMAHGHGKKQYPIR